MTSTACSQCLANRLCSFCYRCNYILLFAFISFSFQAKSQSQESSPNSEIKNLTDRHDSIYYELFKANYVSDKPKAKHYATLAFQSASKSENFVLLGKSCRALSYLFDFTNQLDSSSFYLHKGIKVCVPHSPSDLLINLYNDLGLLHQRLDIYDSALYYLFLSHNMAGQNKSYELQAKTSSNIGLVYSYLEDYPKAILYLKQANDIALANSVGAKFNFNTNRINLARVFNEQSLYQQATEQFELIAANCKNGCDDNLLTQLNYGLGYTNLKKGNLVAADSLFSKALTLSKKSEDDHWLSNTLYNLSIIAIKYKNYAKAIKYLEESRTIADGLNHKRLLRDVYSQLSIAYEKIGSLENAMRYKTLSNELKDSIFNKRIAVAVTGIQLHEQRKQTDRVIQKKETALREKIEELWTANFLAIVLFINCLIAIAIIYLTYRTVRMVKRSKNTLEQELVLMLDAHQVDQRQIYSEQLQFNYLLTRVSGFLFGPVNSLVDLTRFYKANATPEQNTEYINKIRTICVTEILGVLKNIMRLCGIRNEGILPEEIDVPSIVAKVHKEFKDHEIFALMNFTTNKTVTRALNTDVTHLINLIKNGILYFVRSKDISPIEINFEQESNTTIITIKNYSSSPHIIVQEKLFNLFSAQILTLKLKGDTLVTERNEYSTLSILIPTDYNISQEKFLEEPAKGVVT